MIQILENGKDDKSTKSKMSISCPYCLCSFNFIESDIETIYEIIPHTSGIKKFLGLKKAYVPHKYITCPWCKAKLKLKYVIDD